MKILVSKINKDDINEFGSDGYIEAATGGFYSYQVEYGTNPGGLDEVAISDGCDRYIPIAIDNVNALITALSECVALHNQLADASKVRKDVESNDLEAYIDSNHVDSFCYSR